MGEIWVLLRLASDSCSVLGLFPTPEEVHAYVSQNFSRLSSSWYPPLPGRDHWCLADGSEQLVVQRCSMPAEQSAEQADAGHLGGVSSLVRRPAKYYAQARAAYTLSDSRSEPWPDSRPVGVEVERPRRPERLSGTAVRRGVQGSERSVAPRQDLSLSD